MIKKGEFVMFIDVKDGVKKVKDGSIVFKTFGVLAIILLIPFLLCSGVAKIIFGVLFAIVVLFILATLFMCFVNRGSKKEVLAIRERLNEDLKTFQNINKDFVREFCSWYIEWQDKMYGRRTVDSKEAMHLALNLHITKLSNMSVFEKCQELYFSGKEITADDKYKLFELAQKLDKCMKDPERDIIKKQIVDTMLPY